MLLSSPDSLSGVLPSTFQIKLLHIPKNVWFQNRGMKVADGILCASQDVRAGEEDHGLILGENFLRAIVTLFPLFESARRHLFPDEAIDLLFARCSGRRLPWVPALRAA